MSFAVGQRVTAVNTTGVISRIDEAHDLYHITYDNHLGSGVHKAKDLTAAWEDYPELEEVIFSRPSPEKALNGNPYLKHRVASAMDSSTSGDSFQADTDDFQAHNDFAVDVGPDTKCALCNLRSAQYDVAGAAVCGWCAENRYGLDLNLPDDQAQDEGSGDSQLPELDQTPQEEDEPYHSGKMATIQYYAAQQEISVAGLAVVALDTGRVLMLQRSFKDEKDPARGKLEFPGGHMEDGESPIEGAIREWKEETGTILPPGHITGSWVNNIYQGFVYVISHESDIEINLAHEDKHVLNPDDPDGDDIEVAIWFDPRDLPDNPSLRKEVKKTDWSLFKEKAISKEAGILDWVVNKIAPHVPDHGDYGWSYDACRFRRRSRCWKSNILDKNASAQMGYAVWTPKDMGLCHYDSWNQQQACGSTLPGPGYEPGPHAPGSIHYTDATIPFSQGGQRNGHGEPVTFLPTFAKKTGQTYSDLLDWYLGGNNNDYKIRNYRQGSPGLYSSHLASRDQRSDEDSGRGMDSYPSRYGSSKESSPSRYDVIEQGDNYGNKNSTVDNSRGRELLGQHVSEKRGWYYRTGAEGNNGSDIHLHRVTYSPWAKIRLNGLIQRGGLGKPLPENHPVLNEFHKLDKKSSLAALNFVRNAHESLQWDPEPNEHEYHLLTGELAGKHALGTDLPNGTKYRIIYDHHPHEDYPDSGLRDIHILRHGIHIPGKDDIYKRYENEHLSSYLDVQQKAKRLRQEGKVKLLEVPDDTSPYVWAQVEGDHGLYHVLIERKGKKITSAACNCQWGERMPDGILAYERASNSPYKNRRCSHVLAAQYELQSREMYGKTPHTGAGHGNLIGRGLLLNLDDEKEGHHELADKIWNHHPDAAKHLLKVLHGDNGHTGAWWGRINLKHKEFDTHELKNFAEGGENSEELMDKWHPHAHDEDNTGLHGGLEVVMVAHNHNNWDPDTHPDNLEYAKHNPGMGSSFIPAEMGKKMPLHSLHVNDGRGWRRLPNTNGMTVTATSHMSIYDWAAKLAIRSDTPLEPDPDPDDPGFDQYQENQEQERRKQEQEAKDYGLDQASKIREKLKNIPNWWEDDNQHTSKIRQTEKPQKCNYCKNPATQSLLWAEGMAYIPVCDNHEGKARSVIEDKNNDEVVSVHQIKQARYLTIDDALNAYKGDFPVGQLGTIDENGSVHLLKDDMQFPNNWHHLAKNYDEFVFEASNVDNANADPDDPAEDPGQEMNEVGDPQPSQYFMDMHSTSAPNPADSGPAGFGQTLNPDFYDQNMGWAGSGFSNGPGTNPGDDILAPTPVITNMYGLGWENNNGWNGLTASVNPDGTLRDDADKADDRERTYEENPEWEDDGRADEDDPIHSEANIKSVGLTGPQWLMSGSESEDKFSNKEIAKQARKFLATKTFTPEEQQEIINEGELEGVMASNLSSLRLAGTQYEVLEAELQKLEANDDEFWMA